MKMNYRSVLKKNNLFLFLSFFFLLRIIYSYLFGGQEIPDRGDSPGYNGYALAILNQADWLTNSSFMGDYRSPVYPIFLAVIYSMFGAENLFPVYFFQAFINTLTIYYVFRLCESIFKERTAYLALIWAGFYSYYIFYVGLILRETMVHFLMIYSFYHLWEYFNKKEEVFFIKNRDLWKFIIAFTVLLHTDARYLFYVPFIAILFVVYKNIRIGLKEYAGTLGILILLLVPWSIRNYIAYDGFVLINKRTLDMRQEIPSKNLRHLGLVKVEKICNPTEEERELVKKGHNPNKRSQNEVDAILNDRYPTKNELEKRWYNFKLLWRPYHFVNEYKPWPDCRFDPKYSLSDFGLLKALNYGTLLPFMVFGMIYAVVQRQKEAYILIFPIIIQTILHILMWANGRYRNPIDSFVIILGCYGMIVIYEFIKKRTTKNRVYS